MGSNNESIRLHFQQLLYGGNGGGDPRGIGNLAVVIERDIVIRSHKNTSLFGRHCAFITDANTETLGNSLDIIESDFSGEVEFWCLFLFLLWGWSSHVSDEFA